MEDKISEYNQNHDTIIERIREAEDLTLQLET